MKQLTKDESPKYTSSSCISVLGGERKEFKNEKEELNKHFSKEDIDG